MLWPRLPVLMLSMHDEMLYAERTLRAGARGYVSKQASADCILSAIRRVLAGQIYVSEEVSGRILGQLVKGETNAQGQDSVINLLSNRELEVLQFIGRGRGTRDIAAEMHVSVKTVETYRAHIKEKLKLKTAPELMRFRGRLGWPPGAELERCSSRASRNVFRFVGQARHLPYNRKADPCSSFRPTPLRGNR